MARKRRPAQPDDPFGPGDLRLLDLIRSQDTISRAALCTLARRGVAFRAAEPERAAKWLDQLSRHPLFKGGQFLFDLLEWEDFMLDGPPPPIIDEAEVLALLKRITKALASIHGQPLSLESFSESGRPIDASSLPSLEPGFYLYRDVALGALAYILQSQVNFGGAQK